MKVAGVILLVLAVTMLWVSFEVCGAEQGQAMPIGFLFPLVVSGGLGFLGVVALILS